MQKYEQSIIEKSEFLQKKQSNLIDIIQLAWETNAAKVTKSYSHHLPALEQFYRETKSSLLKWTHLI